MVIKLEDVSFTYNENTSLEKKVLSDINLKFDKNKIHGIIGPSGSGKTTLVELISVLDFPTEGRLVLGSKTISRNKKIENLNLLRKKVGFVFQFPEEQIFCNSVRKEIEFGLNFYLKDKDVIDKHVKDSLKMVGLSENFLDRNPYNLSNGEMRKVAIAGVLAGNPNVIILDEPTVGLDNESKNHLIKILKLLKSKYNKTIIVVSHDCDLIHKICDNVIVLNDGKVVMQGDKFDVFTDDEFLNYGLALPKIIEFEKLVLKRKKVRIGFRDDINDLMKDIYRCVK